MNIIGKLPCLFMCIILQVMQFSCSGKKPDFAALPKIDAHFHIHTLDQAVIEQARLDNFRLLTPNTRASSLQFIDEQFRYAASQHKKNPDMIDFASSFTMQGWGQPDWQEKTIAYLQATFNSGAVAVKVWKDIGMTFRDADSSFIMIDNPAFDPVFDFIQAQGKTVLAHQGEPLNCWLPLDSMTVNGDKSYFKNNPQYHIYLHPDYPSHAQLMSARICHLQVQEREKVKNFISKYQDRLLYGTDMGVNENDDPEKITTNVHNTWLEDWEYFTTNDSLTTGNVETPSEV